VLLASLPAIAGAPVVRGIKNTSNMNARFAAMLVDPAASKLWQDWAQGHAGDKQSLRKQIDAGNITEKILQELMGYYNNPENEFPDPVIDECAGVSTDEIADVDPNNFTPFTEISAFRDSIAAVRSAVTLLYTRYTASGQNGETPASSFVDPVLKTAKMVTAAGLLYAHNVLFSSPSLNIFLRTLPAHVGRTLGFGGPPAEQGGPPQKRGRRHSGGSSLSDVSNDSSGGSSGGHGALTRLADTMDKLLPALLSSSSADVDKNMVDCQRLKFIYESSSGRVAEARRAGVDEDTNDLRIQASALRKLQAREDAMLKELASDSETDD
jgi:hypothetical protein